jgi:hypothetical protein
MTMLTEPYQIEVFQILTLRAALRLETLGMTHSSGRSIAGRVRDILGSKTRNKETLLLELDARLREVGIFE